MPVVTVSQINNYMKRYVDQNVHLSDLWIKGEISNFKKHYSGHIYMTLKDETSVINAVMFKSSASRLKFTPTNGASVLAYGRIGVYEKEGTYQLYTEILIPDGVGELYEAYQQLKTKLDSEGLFSDVYKKPLPKMPRKIGIATSVSGAAIRDILNVIERRYNICDLCIYPIKVQGIGASDSIKKALEFFFQKNDCDVIILARGGGSIEDLWAFNEEATARAISNCPIPIITGIGHETDFTIADFVADFRAPTPSAAAEISVPSTDELRNNIAMYCERMNLSIISKIDKSEKALTDYNESDLYDIAIEFYESQLFNYEKTKSKLEYELEKNFFAQQSFLETLNTALEMLNPYAALKRGYSIVTDLKHDVVSDTKTLSEGDKLNIRFANGTAECTVRRIIHENI